MRIPKRLLPHTIIVEPYLGTGARGEKYGPAETWDRVYVEDTKRTQVAPDGKDEMSSTTVWLDPERDLPAMSRVTVWAGTHRERTGRVISTAFYDAPRVPSHTEAFLT